MQHESILTRIAIIPNGEDPMYIYGFETLNDLNLEIDHYSHYRFLRPGTEFEYKNERFRVVEIESTINDVTHPMDPLAGGNSYAIDMPLKYNFEINYFVERI